MDFKKLLPVALEAGLTEKQRDELYNSYVFKSLEAWIQSNVSFSKIFGEELNTKWWDHNLIDFSQKEIDWNKWITEQRIKELWAEHILHMNVVPKIREELMAYDYYDYIKLSVDDKMNIVKKYVDEFDFEGEITDCILHNTLELADSIEYGPDLGEIIYRRYIDKTAKIAEEWLKILDNKYKTLELISKNKNTLCDGVFGYWSYSTDTTHFIQEWIEWLARNYWNVMLYEHNEDLMEVFFRYLYSRIRQVEFGNNAKEEKKLIREYINLLPIQDRWHQILAVEYVVYIETADVEQIEYLFGEVHNRIKKFAQIDKESYFKTLFKKYLDKLFAIKLLNSVKRNEWIETNRDRILEIITTKELEECLELYIVWSDVIKTPDEKQRDIRKGYKIGLVFGDKMSEKAYQIYCERENVFFRKFSIHPKQFSVLCDNFDDQKKLDVLSKIRSKSIDFVIAFETDHETQFHSLIREYSNRISICDFKWQDQHFSKKKFEDLLAIAITKYEKDKINERKLL